MTKCWLGDKNFPQRKLFPDEIFPDKVYLTFMKVLNKFASPSKRPPTSFSAVPPTNRGIRPQIFWIIVSIFLPNLCKISRPYLVPVPNYWTRTKRTHQKNWFFWWNPYKIEVMITSVIKMLELANFGEHILVVWTHLQYNLSTVIKFCWWRHLDKNYDVITFFS